MHHSVPFDLECEGVFCLAGSRRRLPQVLPWRPEGSGTRGWPGTAFWTGPPQEKDLNIRGQWLHVHQLHIGQSYQLLCCCSEHLLCSATAGGGGGGSLQADTFRSVTAGLSAVAEAASLAPSWQRHRQEALAPSNFLRSPKLISVWPFSTVGFCSFS